jgi:hypothetical protein
VEELSEDFAFGFAQAAAAGGVVLLELDIPSVVIRVRRPRIAFHE